MRSRVVAIAGIPGSGKSRLAGVISEATGATLITSHTMVERVDPQALISGRLADMDAMAGEFARLMRQYQNRELVLDGWPRTEAQAKMLPPDTILILLNCRVDIARARLWQRGRPEDTREIIEKRLSEQAAALLPWAFEMAGWEHTINTGTTTAELIDEHVVAYLTDTKKRDMH